MARAPASPGLRDISPIKRITLPRRFIFNFVWLTGCRVIIDSIGPRVQSAGLSEKPPVPGDLEATTLNLHPSHSRAYWSGIVILVAMASIAILPLVDIGWFPSHESLNPVSRVFALAYEIKHGDWYPRWLSLANARQGTPMFNYYSPAAYLFPAYLTALGLPILAAMKLTVWLVFVAGGLGMYLWTRSYARHTGAVVAAILYMYAPYHFVDLYVRGAMSEFTALALLPFLFLGIDRSLSGDGKKGCMIVALSGAAIVLTHNLSALMIAPFALLYWCALISRRKPPKPVIVFSLLGPALGLMLSAFYWLPVILEHEFVQPLGDVMTSGYFSYGNHFVTFRQWFSTAWSFGDSLPGPRGQMSFQIGVTLSACAVVTTLIWRRIPEHARLFGGLCAILAVSSLFMTTAPSGFIYELVPGFEYIQFPWRFLGPASLFLSAYCGLLVYLGSSFKLRASLLVTVLLGTLIFSSDHRGVAEGIDLTDEYIATVLMDERGMGDLGGIGEYNPVWSNNTRLPWFGPVSRAPGAFRRISRFEVDGSTMRFKLTANRTRSEIMLPWYYFPGWRVEVDGVETRISPSENGFIKFDVPASDHEVVAYFGTTRPRQAGWFIALLGFACIAFLYRQSIRRPI